jgi:hypothetical protein
MADTLTEQMIEDGMARSWQNRTMSGGEARMPAG